jgi:hypothetical protein
LEKLLLGRALGSLSALEEVGRKQRRLDELLETSQLEINTYNLIKARLE